MDLFGRKAKRRYDGAITLILAADKVSAELWRENAALTAQNEALSANQKELRYINESLIRKLSEVVKPASQQIEYPPAAKMPRVANHGSATHMSDEEAELQWRHNNNLIDTEAYTDLLRNLDFDNAEIQLAPEYGAGPGQQFSY